MRFVQIKEQNLQRKKNARDHMRKCHFGGPATKITATLRKKIDAKIIESDNPNDKFDGSNGTLLNTLALKDKPVANSGNYLICHNFIIIFFF